MREWKAEDLNMTVDGVMRGQGADPDIIRTRSPKLIEIATEALHDSINRLKPRVLHEVFQVTGLTHEKMILDSGKYLSGALVTSHLVGAQQIVVVVCTVGSDIDQYAVEIMEEDLVRGLAVDGVGSAAVEALANAVCREIELEGASRGQQSTIPLSPGMIGWSVEQGQPCIFDLVDPQQIGVKLTPHQLMIPRKSLSMIIGLGPTIATGARICDYCLMRETCRYQDHSALEI
jgi:hypothetical protein